MGCFPNFRVGDDSRITKLEEFRTAELGRVNNLEEFRKLDQHRIGKLGVRNQHGPILTTRH